MAKRCKVCVSVLRKDGSCAHRCDPALAAPGRRARAAASAEAERERRARSPYQFPSHREVAKSNHVAGVRW